MDGRNGGADFLLRLVEIQNDVHRGTKNDVLWIYIMEIRLFVYVYFIGLWFMMFQNGRSFQIYLLVVTCCDVIRFWWELPWSTGNHPTPSRLSVWRPYNTPTHPTTSCWPLIELPSKRILHPTFFLLTLLYNEELVPFVALKLCDIHSTSFWVKVGALESAIGLTLLESQAVNAGFPTSAEVVLGNGWRGW